jgi:hypothetical protein
MGLDGAHNTLHTRYPEGGGGTNRPCPLTPAPEIPAAVLAFIDQRPGYVKALKDTNGADDDPDYWRWSGHAEARRQLATALGLTVPHNPGDRAGVPS